MNHLPIAGTVIRGADQSLATWPGGTTRTIYTYPPSAQGKIQSAQLYIGTATIARDGPYSVFTDRTRIHMPMRGNGLHLHFAQPAETMLLHSFEQATFPGDRPLTVTLVDGMVEAFNLIFTAHVAATVDSFTVEQGAELTLPAQANTVRVLYLVEGSGSIQQEDHERRSAEQEDGETVRLAESDAYIGDGAARLRIGAPTVASHLLVAVAKLG